MAARPQYPFWEVVEIAPGPGIARIRAIMEGASAADFKNMLIRIGKRIIPGNNLPCEALFLEPGTPIEYFYPRVINGQMIRNYVVMDTQLRAPVGYMQLAVPPNLADGVFTHNDFELVKALAVEISWNCSFTMSPARPRAGQPILRDYYAAQVAAFNIKLAKFMHNQIAEQLLAALGRIDVEHVLFYSVGAEEARPQHRKNGKRNTCTFVNEWRNMAGQTIPVFYNKPIAHNTMFYLYMPNGADFIGSLLYRALIVNGSDLSLPGDLPPGHADYFKDVNWNCRYEAENEEMAGGVRQKKEVIHFLTKRRTKKMKRTRRQKKCTHK